MDGMTYKINMDTNNGHIDFLDKMSNDMDGDERKPFSLVNKQELENIFENRI